MPKYLDEIQGKEMSSAKSASDPDTARNYRARKDLIFVLILVVGVAIRLYLASATSYIWDEHGDWIPIAERISLKPGNVYLPVHDFQHPSLPAYFIKAGSMLLGENRIGFRFFSLLAGMLTIVLAFRFALKWIGPTAARWTAALLAFNEYHIVVSILATEKSFHLLSAMLAMYAFSRFIHTEKPGYLYLAGASTGLGFLCKYIPGLLIPIFFTALLFPEYRPWLRRKEPYIAFLLFLVVITPDLYWNLKGLLVEGAQLDQSANISDHFSRAGGPGFNSHHFLFYVRGAVRKVYSIVGWELWDPVSEYPSMNSLFGLILFGGVLLTTFHGKRKDSMLRFLVPLFCVVIGFVVLVSIGQRLRGEASEWHLLNFLFGLILFGGIILLILRYNWQGPILRFLVFSFWAVFGFFVLIRPGNSPGLDSVVWFWVDMTLLIAALLVGRYLSGLQGKWRFACYAITGVAGLCAVIGVLAFRLGMP